MTTLAGVSTTEAACRAQLRWLARCWDASPEGVRVERLHEAAHPHLLAEELARIWESYLGHLALADGMDNRPWALEAHWTQVNDELTPPGQWEAAYEEIWQRVGADEDLLLWGKR